MKNKSKQVYINKRIPIQIDAELQRLFKIAAATEKTPMKTLVEGFITDYLWKKKHAK